MLVDILSVSTFVVTNWFNFFLSSLLLIHMLETSGVFIQVTIILIVLWILLRTSLIQYVPLSYLHLWIGYGSREMWHLLFIFLWLNSMQLCTLEFETRRASYYWLLHVLDLYLPYVWEYSRLNITNTVMSKRKVCWCIEHTCVQWLTLQSCCLIFYHIGFGLLLQLNRLVTEKWVDGWDDPRLMTLAGLRRRGVTSTAINTFIRGIGITRRSGYFV